MFIPTARDIATTEVVSIDIHQSIENAIGRMLASEHRDIVIENEKTYYLLRAIDTIELYKNHTDLSLPLNTLTLTELVMVTKATSLVSMLPLVQNDIEYIGVKDDEGSLYGLITNTDITSGIDPQTLLKSYTIKEFFAFKRDGKLTAHTMPTQEAFEQMYANRQDHILILEENKPIGILTTKDFIRLIKHKADLSLPVVNYMTSPVFTIDENATLYEAISFLQEKKIKRLVAVNKQGEFVHIIGQKELISLTYTKWATLMREKEKELLEMNKQLSQQSKEYEILASKDKLTGLYNRYKLEELFSASQTLMFHKEEMLYILMLDIDHFKQINDTYGHAAGDAVLQRFASLLKQNTRNADVIARWGGEEFVILLSSVNFNTALKIANNLRQRIATADFDLVPKVTASFGVTQVHSVDSLESAVARADKALYLAKHSGRNCVEYIQE